MSYGFEMLVILLVGVGVLMAGILVARGPGQSFDSAFKDSLLWGSVCGVSYGVEFIVLANV